MTGITDIHTHIIPGVDDGAADIDESIELIRREIDQGVTCIFATSHNSAYDDDPANVTAAYKMLRSKVAELKLPVEIYRGCEILCYPEDMDDIILNLKRGVYPTMNKTRYVLIEFEPYLYPVEDALYCIKRLGGVGYVPITAHAERYDLTTTESAALMKDNGALIQINAYSVESERSDKIKGLANDLLQKGLVDFIGSDCHRLDHRPPVLQSGIEAVRRMCPEDYADAILCGNALRYLMSSCK